MLEDPIYRAEKEEWITMGCLPPDESIVSPDSISFEIKRLKDEVAKGNYSEHDRSLIAANAANLASKKMITDEIHSSIRKALRVDEQGNLEEL